MGPWRVEGYSGRGTYGVVYQARRTEHPCSAPVALKMAVFPSDRRFHREVEVLSRHRHPGIPRLFDQGVWHASDEVSHPYLVMEWIRGRTLYEWARLENPTCREVLRVLAQVAWALEVLHRSACLHRDVKGDNVLVEPEGRAVLTDFGSATWKGAPPLTERVLPPNTREYRSPESLRFEWAHWRTKGAHYEASPEDDLYALGVTLYRLVTGVYPPPGTDPEALKAHLQEPPPRRLPAHDFNKRVAPALSALIERLLSEEPCARGPAREIAEAAERMAQRAGPEADEPFLDLEWPEAPAHGRRIWAEPEPVRACKKRRPQTWGARRVFLAAGVAVAFVYPCWMAPDSSLESRAELALEAPAMEMTPDAGTKGLGDEALTARVETLEAPSKLEAVTLEIPKQPLAGQRRPPCQRSWEVVINGGCWKLLAGSKPPCGEGEYEWQEGCYDPALDRKRPPTSEKEQQQ